MPTLFAKKNNKQLNHKSGEVSKKVKETQNEMKKPGNADNSPGIFNKFVTWVKSIFSKEPNLEQNATTQGNMNAAQSDVSPSDINGTLSPQITGEGVSPGAAAHGTVNAPSKSEASAIVEKAERESAFANAEFEAAVKAADKINSSAASEEGNTAGEKAPENAAEDNTAEEKKPEFTPGVNITEDKTAEPNINNRLTIGDMNLDTFEIEGYTFTQSGNLKVFGKTVWWTADKKINLTTEDGKKFFGSGLIRFSAEGLSYKGKKELEAELILMDNIPAYYFKEGLCYTQDGIMVNVGDWLVDLNEITATEIPLFNYSTQSEAPMLGKITVDGSGLKGSAQKDIVWFPTALFKGVDAPKLIFGESEDSKLGFSLPDDKKLTLSAGVENLAELKGTEPVSVEVLEDGKIAYRFSGKNSVDFFGGLYKKEFEIAPVNITMDQGLSGIEVPEFDLNIGEADLKKISLNFSEKGGSISAGTLAYKGLKIENLSGELGESGITAKSDKFEFPIGSQTLSGSVEGFEWKKGAKTFSVSKFALAVDKFPLGKNISIDGASVEFSLKEDNFSFGAEGTLSVKELKTGWLTVTAEELKAKFSLAKGSEDNAEADKGGKNGLKLAASFEGSIKFSVGTDDAVEANAENISYEDGKFGVETLSIQTTFKKLISDKFSGDAALTANGLKFSDKVELDSLGLEIKNLVYNNKKLVSEAKAEIIFKEGQDENSAAADADKDAELTAGEDTGILKNGKISIYLLENKKGAEITAGGLDYAFDYVAISFVNVKAGLFTLGGSNEISAESGELKSGKKLNDFLNADSFSLAASKCKISSKGIELGKVTADVNELKLAQALTLNSLKAEMEFGEAMAFQSFDIKSSAKLGKISISELDLKISQNNGELSAGLETEEIDCGEDLKNLKITGVKGSFSKGEVTVSSAAFTFKIAGTDITGSLTNLSWSSEDSFSVEQMTVSTGEIAINDSLTVKGGKITASIKNKSFSIGAEAAFKFDEKKGIVKINGDLSLALNVSDESKEGESKLSASGSVEGKLGVVVGDNIASADVSDIEYKDGEFSVSKLDMTADLSKLGSDKLGGTGNISVNSLKFKKGVTPAVGSMVLTVSALTYNGKTMMSGLSVNVILDGTTKSDDAEGGAGGEESVKADEAELALDNDIDGKLTGLDVSVYLTEQFKGVKLGADKFGVAVGNFKFDFDSFDGRFGSEKGSAVCDIKLGGFSMESVFSDDNNIAKAIGIQDLKFKAENVSVKDNKFNVEKISAEADNINICGFQISKVSVNTGFDDKWNLTSLEIGGDLDYGNNVSASGVSANFSAEKKEGGISVEKLTYKELTIEDLSGKIGGSGIAANAKKFEFPIGGQTLTGSLEGLEWKPGETFTVSKFALAVGGLSFGENISLNDTSMEFSLKKDSFSFLAEGTLSLKELKTGWLTVNADELKIKFSMGTQGDNAEADNGGENGSKVAASVEGSIKFSVGTGEAVTANAKNISYKDGEFGVETLTLETSFDKLISDKFSGNAALTANGLKFSKNVDLDSLGMNIKNLAYNGKKLVSGAKAEIIFKEGQDENSAVANTDKDAELTAGGDTGKLKNGKISIYLLENKKGAQITAGGLDYAFDYVAISFVNVKAALFTLGGENEISSENAELKSGKRLNEILGVESLSLAASNCKISSKGIEIGKVTADVKNLTIANALTLNDLTSEMEFGEKMAFQSFKIKSSAALGNIKITEFGLKIADNSGNASAEMEANEIDCGGNFKDLKITDVKGSFAKDKVTVDNAAFTFTIAGTDVSGSLEKLSWSSEDSFSVEKMTVSTGEIAINSDFTVSGADITASVKNKSFSIGAKATFQIKDISKGIVKINGTELTVSLNLSDEKGEDGKSKLSVSGSVEGKIGVEIVNNIASADVSDIEYKDGEFSVGKFDMGADLSKFGSDKLGGTGNISVNSLKFKKGETPTVGAMGLTVSDLSYNGRSLMSDLSVNIILDGTAKSDNAEGGAGGENSAKADEADLALNDGVDGKLTGLDISVYLTEQFKGVQIDANSFSITPKNFEFKFNKFSGKFGSEKGSAVCNMQLGELTVNSDLTDNKIAQAIGIKKLNFTAENASVENNKFKLGKMSAQVDGDIKIGGFQINNVNISTEFNDDMKLKSLKVGGELAYGNYVKGGAALTVSEDGVSFDDIENIKVSYGSFKGTLKKIEFDNKKNTVQFKELTLEKKTGEDNDSQAGFEEETSGSLVAKFLRTVPDITIEVKELTFEDGKLKKPSTNDISIKEFKKTFTLCKGTEATVGYSGGDNGKFTIGGSSCFALPDGGGAKMIPFIHAPITIVPPVLSADFELGMEAGISAKINFSATAERNDNTLDLDTELNADADGTFGFYGSAALKASALIVSISGGVLMELTLNSKIDLNGKFGITYDSNAESFFKAFKVAKDKTSLGFELNSDLNFDVKIFGEIKGLPAIFSKKKLYHSWDLFHYNLMGVNIKGSIAYDQDRGKYKFSADPTVTNASKLSKYSPKKTQDKIDEFGNSLGDLQNGMKSINSLLAKVKSGVDESKGSTDEINGTEKDDLGSEVQGTKDKLMAELKKRIDNVFQDSKKNSLQCHTLMVELREIIENNAQTMVKNENSVQQLEKVISESKTALDIVGYKLGDGEEFNKAAYAAFIAELIKLKEDEERINRLAELEPAAVVNMFKAFKLDGTKSWGALHDQAEELTDEQIILAASGDEFKSQFKPKIYDSAMKGLSDLLADKEKRLEAQKNAVAAAEKALQDAKNARKKLEEDYNKEIRELDAKITNNRAKRDSDIAAVLESANQTKLQTIKEARSENAERIKNAEAEAEKKRSELNKKLENEKAPQWMRTSWQNDLNEIDTTLSALREKENEAMQAKINRANEDYDKASAASEVQNMSWEEINRIPKNRARHTDAEKILTIKLDCTWANNDCDKSKKQKKQDLDKNIPLADQDIVNAQATHEEAQKQLADLKEQMLESADISTAMTGFQGFINEEYNGTVRGLNRERARYVTSQEPAVQSPETSGDKAKRRENVIAIIDRLIADATEDNLNDRFVADGKRERAQNKVRENVERHTARLKTLQDQSGIVDVNMRGFGLPKFGDSTKAFNTMKADSDKFKTMQEQLDAVYKRLTDFHDVMRQALESWNAANGINFKEKYSITAFSDSSLTALNLIDEVVNKTDSAEKNQISGVELDKLSNEFNKLNSPDGASLPQTSAAASMNPEQIKKESELLGVG